MSPAEAGAVLFEEPDWKVLFEEQCSRWPKLPRYLQEDSAFPEVMRQWRRFHWTPIMVDGEEKKNPAGAVEAMIALAILGIMPPRSTDREVPRDGELGYQHDEMMWLHISQEAWRIVAVEDRMLHIQQGFEAKPRTMQIDLNKAKWNKYVEGMSALLESLGRPG